MNVNNIKICDDYVESRITYYRDIYENGPLSDDPSSIDAHNAFVEIKQQDSEGYSADQFVVEFTEHISSRLYNIQKFQEKGWVDNELLIATQLFKDVSRNLPKVANMTSAEYLVPYISLVFQKATDYIMQDKNNRFASHHSRVHFINEFKKHLYKAKEVIDHFLKNNVLPDN